MTLSDRKQKDVPPPVLSNDPEAELERRLRERPDDLDTKADVGSDESMDASDPPSVTRGSGNEPVPSSGFPSGEDDER
jgi:hypothetical protein